MSADMPLGSSGVGEYWGSNTKSCIERRLMWQVHSYQRREAMTQTCSEFDSWEQTVDENHMKWRIVQRAEYLV